jgi:aspartate dehydrogenase
MVNCRGNCDPAIFWDVNVKDLLLIGCGAMGRYVLRELHKDERVRIRYVLEVGGARRAELQEYLGSAVKVIDSLDEIAQLPDFALECAGQDAVRSSVAMLLRRGIDTIIASVGALAQEGLPKRLERAALEGGARLILVPGAIAGIDALSAASIRPLDAVTYIGRKPPAGWIGTPAEKLADLGTLQEATTIFAGNAREAALLYPKNANVAAMVALAGIGFERTEVSLVADPSVARNTHTVHARGQFGEIQITVSALPLADNPKTSELAALSVVRAVRNQSASIVM